MTRILIFIFFRALYFPVNGQVVKNSSQLLQRFHSFNTVHILNGSSTTSLAINTVNGFQFSRFFAGIGTGFDYYYQTTIPLFAEGRFDLVEGKNKLQLFANGGFSFPFSSKNRQSEGKTGPYKTGGMYDAGLDYHLAVKNEAFILGAAFSNKQVRQMIDNNIWNPVLNQVENIPIKEEYSLNRIVIRIGWMF
ncbi:MAG: hypothetical protein ABIN67_13035 [Ferruginibacter sp.]